MFISTDLVAQQLGKNSISDFTEIERAVILQKIAAVEAAISKHYVDLSAATSRVEFLPVSDRELPDPEDLVAVDVVDNRVVTDYWSDGTDILQLSYTPVLLAGLVINEHTGAYGGQATGAFAIATQLINGVDYYLDIDTPGRSSTGIVRRIYGSWSQEARSIKVTYTSGSLSLSADDTALVTEVILLSVAHAYRFWKRTQNVSPGGVPVNTESIGKYSYSAGGAVGSSGTEFGGMSAIIPDEFGGMISHLFNWGKVI